MTGGKEEKSKLNRGNNCRYTISTFLLQLLDDNSGAIAADGDTTDITVNLSTLLSTVRPIRRCSDFNDAQFPRFFPHHHSQIDIQSYFTYLGSLTTPCCTVI